MALKMLLLNELKEKLKMKKITYPTKDSYEECIRNSQNSKENNPINRQRQQVGKRQFTKEDIQNVK